MTSTTSHAITAIPAADSDEPGARLISAGLPVPRPPEHEGNQGAAAAGSCERQLVAVLVTSLLPGDSPRLKGEDAKHVAHLAELDGPLPPILVDRCSMRVIDGMHRLRAAALRGEKTIEVDYFEGTTEEAFLRAVEANVAHGLPLSQEDRRAATRRIIVSHPQMSDRAIARASGLSAKSVATIRQESATTAPPLTKRIGIDGKARPVDSADGRRRAAELIAEFPLASLRDVARRAGISPATVSDVRKRLASGVAPVPDGGTSRSDHPSEERIRPATPMRRLTGLGVSRAEEKPRPVLSVLEDLLADPSLRMREDGRKLLRLLQRSALERDGVLKLASTVPRHCSGVVADLARQYAEVWASFAEELDESVRSTGTDD